VEQQAALVVGVWVYPQQAVQATHLQLLLLREAQVEMAVEVLVKVEAVEAVLEQ
jgi:hypothetical protein